MSVAHCSLTCFRSSVESAPSGRGISPHHRLSDARTQGRPCLSAQWSAATRRPLCPGPENGGVAIILISSSPTWPPLSVAASIATMDLENILAGGVSATLDNAFEIAILAGWMDSKNLFQNSASSSSGSSTCPLDMHNPMKRSSNQPKMTGIIRLGRIPLAPEGVKQRWPFPVACT